MGESYDDCVHGCMCGCGMHEGCVILAIATGPASANSTPFSLTCGLLGIGSKRMLKLARWLQLAEKKFRLQTLPDIKFYNKVL